MKFCILLHHGQLTVKNLSHVCRTQIVFNWLVAKLMILKYKNRYISKLQNKRTLHCAEKKRKP